MVDVDELERCRDIAIRAVQEAGAFVASARPHTITRKSAATGGGDSEASRVLTEVDARSQSIVLEMLASASLSFDPGVLSEELADDGGRHQHSHFWCVDPLDGTLPFVEGVPGYAVSVALVERAGVPVVGAVFDPSTSRLFDAARGCGARLNGTPWPRVGFADDDLLHVFADRSFAGASNFERVCSALRAVATGVGCVDVRVHQGAGAVMNACGALLHGPACYLKLPKKTRGGGSVWDFSATACIATELGAAVSDASGSPLALNPTGSTFMNETGVLFATDPVLGLRIRDAVAPFSSLHRGRR